MDSSISSLQIRNNTFHRRPSNKSASDFADLYPVVVQPGDEELGLAVRGISPSGSQQGNPRFQSKSDGLLHLSDLSRHLLPPVMTRHDICLFLLLLLLTAISHRQPGLRNRNNFAYIRIQIHHVYRYLAPDV